jgi:glutamate N-acetyltransferase/amino-acid N-acetyltransferase
MSTNDSVYIFANGAAVPTEQKQDHLIDEEKDAESYQIFRGILTDFAQDLAKLVVRDGEGATKFVTVTVKVDFLSFCTGRTICLRSLHRVHQVTVMHTT